MGEYEWVTDEMFDLALLELMYRHGMNAVFKIPGVYEAVREEYNNEALELLEQRRKEGQ